MSDEKKIPLCWILFELINIFSQASKNFSLSLLPLGSRTLTIQSIITLDGVSLGPRYISWDVEIFKNKAPVSDTLVWSFEGSQALRCDQK